VNKIALSLVVGLVGYAVVVSAAAASCMPTSAAQHRARAAVIFDGVALDAPTGTGVQRFRVTRYLKGAGPRIARANTGFIRHAGSGTLTSVSLVVHRGERWRIFGRGQPAKVIRSNLCDGSRKR
jgi:hypothetical protein